MNNINIKIPATKRLLTCLVYTLFYVLLFSCKKGWLEEKPMQSLVVPNTLEALETLLNNSSIFNTDHQPSLSEVGTDDYYITNETFENRSQLEKNMYTWASVPNFYDGSDLENYNWDRPYKIIYYCNTILENVEKLPKDVDYPKWAMVKGSALFSRGYSLFNLSQIFCKPYLSASANTDPGLVIRVNSDMNIKLSRSSVSETYKVIIQDLTIAKDLLPTVVGRPTKPNKAAACAMLARVYLSMNDFEQAGRFADSCLEIKSTLNNYNEIDFNNLFPFERFNPEVLYHTMMLNQRLLPTVFNASYVDSNLYTLYSPYDIRKKAFFSELFGTLGFLGTYEGTFFFFTGLAVDEVYLIKSECMARQNDINGAMSWLNKLLDMRYETGQFNPLSATTSQEALSLILEERRKELCFRGIRWTDIRRLSQDEHNKVTLTRKVGNDVFTLPPTDVQRYVYPIPQSEILYSGIEQNKR